ncbi:uncharacterized protein [Cicer arietinum]|uniref:Acyl-coenzyme A thioesterase 13 n=1 Tax=Cicer arietinum TaxID=3827 RepID=A0A1S2YE10_CICAR|nr:putative esterase F42H10.6 [Cicer arietinum]
MEKTEGRIRELESIVKKYLENEGEGASTTTITVDGLPPLFIEPLIFYGLHLDLMEPGRVVFSMKIPPRLLNGKYLHGGAIVTLVDVIGAAAIPAAGFPMDSGVSLEINVSHLGAAYVHEEIEIDAKVLRVGKVIAVVSVDFRKKMTGQIFAQGRHTKFLPISSKM